jgi:hypothetical protein
VLGGMNVCAHRFHGLIFTHAHAINHAHRLGLLHNVYSIVVIVLWSMVVFHM